MQFKGLKEWEMSLELMLCEDYNTKYGFSRAIKVNCSLPYKYTFLNRLEKESILIKNSKGYHLNRNMLWKNICDSHIMQKIIQAIDNSPNKRVLEFDKFV